MISAVYGIYGARGHGRDVLSSAEAAVSVMDNAELVFIDDEPPAPSVCGMPVLSWQDFLARPAGSRHAALAPSSGAARAKLAGMLADAGVQPWSLTGAGTLVSRHAHIGKGALVNPLCVISANVRIGDFFQMNTMCNLAHDCVVGDYVTLAPGVMCSGFVQIADFAYVGAGATIRQGSEASPLRIGQGAIVGMGAVVTHDVPDGEVWAGNPARRMK